jgi:hypothetical protein
MFVSGNLIGGLGNQLFILNSAIDYGKKHNRQVIFTQVYSNPHCSQDISINELFPEIPLRQISSFKTIKTIHSTDPHEYLDIPNMSEELVILEGYFQNKSYMTNFDEDTWKNFKSRLPSPQLNINLSDICFLHVRRTDYLGNSLFEFNPINYYTKAIESVICPIIILSDDMEWSSKEIPKLFPNKTWIIPSVEMTASQTLYVMCHCDKGAICANSTLSWWGAWLNQNRYITMPNIWTEFCRQDQLYFEGVAKISRN